MNKWVGGCSTIVECKEGKRMARVNNCRRIKDQKNKWRVKIDLKSF